VPDSAKLRFFSRRFLRQPPRELALAEHVARALAGLDEAILDGEMLGWDPHGGADGAGAMMNHFYTRSNRLVARVEWQRL
jgi:ATP-dependent DNA ligase